MSPPDESTTPIRVFPPDPHYVHPYGGTAFTGRDEELATLDEWAAQDGKPVMAWVAIGGMGKSALAWHWVRQHADEYEGLLWWSFYDATFGEFIDEAIAYLSDGKVDAAKLQGGEKVPTLTNLLRERRYLLALDGFERELAAYRGLKAAYREDWFEDAPSEAGDPRLECMDPQAREFLQNTGVLIELPSKVLITSRLFPNALADRNHTQLDGVRHEHLTGLKPDDAVDLFHALGVKGTRAEIEAACERLGYHPFSLRLLAGRILGDKRRPGDIAVAPTYRGIGEEALRQTHILEVSYEQLGKERQQFLSRLAAFRSAMDYAALETVAELPTKRRVLGIIPVTQTGIDLDATLEDLLTRGLLFRDEAGLYDLHPIARRYAYQRLTDPQTTHARLRDYFDALPQVDTEQAERLEDLAPVIELYHHTLNAGEYDAAQQLLYSRLMKVLYYRLGAYQILVDLLNPLAPRGKSAEPRLKNPSTRAWVSSALSLVYGRIGKPLMEMQELEAGLEIIAGIPFERPNYAKGLSGLGIAQHEMGAFTDAASNLRNCITLAIQSSLEHHEGVGRKELGRTLAYTGSYAEAKKELARAEQIDDLRYKKGAIENGPTLIRAYRAEMYLLQGDPRAALESAREAEVWHKRVAQDQFPYEADLIRNKWLLGASLRRLGNLETSDGLLNEALARCRRTNLVRFEGILLLELGYLRREQKRPDEALELTEEALVIADRAGYRLQQADLHYLLALLAQDAGDVERAREHAQIARERAWCDDEMHYQRTLDQAEALLKELG